MIARIGGKRACVVCSVTIEVGDELWPIDVSHTQLSAASIGGKQLQGGQRQWVHKQNCAPAILGTRELKAPICKHYARRGVCVFGTDCFYDHPAQLPIGEGKEQAGEVSPAGRKKGRLGNTARNTGRAGAFRRWLIDTYGREMMGAGSGVLDVAGGKGELSFELVNLNKISSCVVDPRPLQVDKYARNFSRGNYEMNSAFAKYMDVKSSVTAPRRPSHLRVMFEMGSCTSGETRKRDAGTSSLPLAALSSESFADAIRRGHEIVYDRKGLRAIDVEEGHEEEDDEEEEQEAEEEAEEGGAFEVGRGGVSTIACTFIPSSARLVNRLRGTLATHKRTNDRLKEQLRLQLGRKRGRGSCSGSKVADKAHGQAMQGMCTKTGASRSPVRRHRPVQLILMHVQELILMHV
jgi:hypothetical protein